MQALYLGGDADGPRVEDRPDPEPGAGEVRVRVAWAGVCNTDLELAKGYMGFRGVLGHEFVGEVQDGPEEWRGRRVVGEINFACGDCEACGAGLGRHCPTRRVMGIKDADGAFAEWLVVPSANLHTVPDAVTDEEAVFVEPLAAAFEILEQRPVEPGERCIVFGDGKLGLLAAQVLHAAGAHVLAVGRHAPKLALLARRGIETLVDDGRALRRAPLVVEATGNPDGLPRALLATRPRGTLVLKSTFAERPRVDLAPVVIDEIELLGSRCGPFEPALTALESGAVEVAPLVHDRLPLRRAVDALRLAGEPGAQKVLVDCG